ncbi:YbhB/YbcL family Raf kinase inhibitor-like protein [Pseudomonas entomophila]|uniref:YbhB/YbcL family Raf kinase inhibitor-like protein n=1 Tax=Pseudomonas entomophila TaxID=312306 RepID=UPI003EB795DC
MKSLLPACVIALTFAASPVVHADSLKIESDSFDSGQALPQELVGKGPSCGDGGKDWSPAVRWYDLPKGTRSVALVMVDPDGNKGLGVVHWVAYNIDARMRKLDAGAARFRSNWLTVGRNSTGAETYKGPCPPQDDNPHHYVLTLIASDLPPTQLPSGLDRDGLMKALNGHALGAQTLVGTYGQ